MRLFLAAALTLFAQSLIAQQTPPDASAIMARVAANQDQSEAERIHFLYLQHARVVSRKGKTIRCEEITDTRVTPTETGSQQQLLKLDGRMLTKHDQYVTYNRLLHGHDGSDTPAQSADGDINVTVGDDTLDRGLVEDMRNGFTNSRSKDGIGAGLFPLTSKTQANYAFRLVGREKMNGREVFHIVFEPKDKSDITWKGDAFIDTTAYQPVLVRTTKARQIPFAVRTLLGTNLPGLGFTVIYAPQASAEAGEPSADVWFPISFGTEFKIKVLFLFSREITLDAENHAFERTHVNSKIVPVAP